MPTPYDRTRALLLATSAAGMIVWAPAAFAQTAAPDGPAATTQPATPAGAAPSEDGLEDIVVTARRTSEKLQDIPLAVTAVTDKAIRANNIVNLQSLNGLTPSLNYQSSGARTSSGRVFFRGLTTGAGGQASKASIFLDGNYLAGTAQNIPFNYFERIEALPGPQSAQFGRATFGGAINYVTKDPARELSGVVHADYASYNDINLDAFIGGPVGLDGRLRASVFGSFQKFDAPDKWRTPPDVLHPNGVRQGAQDEKYGAGKLIFDATDNLTLRLGASYSQFKDGPGVFYLTEPGPLKNGAFQRYTLSADRTQATPIANTFLYYPVGSTAYGNHFTSLQLAQNFYNIPDPNVHDHDQRYNGQLLWNVAGHTVTLNGFHEFETSHLGGSDGDNTYFPSSSFLDSRSRINTSSVELRIASDQEQRLHYVIGGYYLDTTSRSTSNTLSMFRCTSTTVGCTTTNPAALFNPTIVAGALSGFTGTAVAVNVTTPSSSSLEIKDKSVFGSLGLDVTEKLIATAEMRYQVEDQDSRNYISNFVGQGTFKAFLPRLSVQYRFTPEVQVYGVYSIGNNPGGFNAVVAPYIGQGIDASALTYKEEKLYNYELGFKSTLLDNHLVFNATVFDMEWKNQIASTTVFTNVAPFTAVAYQANRGNSRVRGAELQLTVLPVRDLTLGASLSYNNAKYVNYCSTSAVNIAGYVTPGRVGCIVVDGNYLENVPAVTASATADYRFPLTGSWEGVLGGNFRYRDGQWESDLNLGKSAPQYLFDLRAGVESDKLTISLFCSNCTDSKATDRSTNLADVRLGATGTLNRTVSFAPRRPRQFGVRTAFRF